MTTAVTTDPVEDYLRRCGGKDTLVFASDAAAADAAQRLRRDHPTIKVEARFNKVFLTWLGQRFSKGP